MLLILTLILEGTMTGMESETHLFQYGRGPNNEYVTIDTDHSSSQMRFYVDASNRITKLIWHDTFLSKDLMGLSFDPVAANPDYLAGMDNLDKSLVDFSFRVNSYAPWEKRTDYVAKLINYQWNPPLYESELVSVVHNGVF